MVVLAMKESGFISYDLSWSNRILSKMAFFTFIEKGYTWGVLSDRFVSWFEIITYHKLPST